MRFPDKPVSDKSDVTVEQIICQLYTLVPVSAQYTCQVFTAHRQTKKKMTACLHTFIVCILFVW